MKIRSLIGMLTASAMLFAVAMLSADDKDKLASAKCPVSGKAVKAESAADYKGGKVYFCCDNCPDAFKKDTAKFAAKANQQLALTGQAKQAKCPLTGKDTDSEQTVDVGGAKVAFCCGNCKGKVAKATGDAQRDLVFNDKAFDKGFKVGK